MAIKHALWLLVFFALGLRLSAQNYQYQYPYDPYSGSPQPRASGGSSSGSDYAFDKLLTYGSLEARYNFNDFKDSKFDNSSGFSVGLRAPLFKPLFIGFGLNWLHGTNQKNQSFDLTTITGGGGAYLPLGSRFHLFGEVGGRFDISGGDLSSINPDNASVYLRPGIRFAATEKLELAASVLFSSTNNLDDQIVELNTYYSVFSVLDLGLGADLGSNVNTYHASLRLRW